MNFNELQLKVGKQFKKNWYKHKNGGGWVNKAAKVNKLVFIKKNAIVFSGQVLDNAKIFDNTLISGNARVSENAQIQGDAQVYGYALIIGDKWKKSPLFIVGSKHSLINSKEGFIQIGHRCQSIDWWLKNYESFFKKVGYIKKRDRRV